jgi:Cof subfamily protein (haloacid dehalogenase superfamily)
MATPHLYAVAAAARTLPPGVRPGGRFATWNPGRPRYVVVDVDGTLLHDGPAAAPAVVAHMAGCRTAGLPVGLATGRMPAAVVSLIEQLGLPGPHVLHNGAQVHGGGRTLHSWPLRPADARRLRAICAEHDLYAEFYVGEGYLVTDRREAARSHWALMGRDPDGLVDDADLDGTEVVKATVVLFAQDPAAAVFAALRRAGLSAGPAHAPALPGVTFVNVTSPAADKGQALREAARHVGCSLREVVAVGDGLNDLSMLAVAGTAMAMGQAPPEVQRAAHLVVPEVARDGVVAALQWAITWSRR